MINSPASTIKAIEHDLHCYHFYGNNASRFEVPNITNKVKEKTCGPCVSFRNFYKGIQKNKQRKILQNLIFALIPDNIFQLI